MLFSVKVLSNASLVFSAATALGAIYIVEEKRLQEDEKIKKEAGFETTRKNALLFFSDIIPPKYVATLEKNDKPEMPK